MEKFLLNIKPREYQKEIFEKTKDKNSLIILPTGIGKTLIGLMLSIHRMQKHPTEKILFLAPTRPLAEQHFAYFQKHLPELFAQIDLFTGKINAENRKKIWQRSDIIFSTPQCIANDLKKYLYKLTDVSLLIEDEAHRCVKNYSYTFVAKKYKEQALNPQIIGLTASPGTDKKTIKTICDNLSIENVEIRTRESEDVKQYLQDIEINTIKVEFPKKFQEIKNHLQKIYESNIKELKDRNLMHAPANKITLLEAQKKMMSALSKGDKDYNLYGGVSICAQAIKTQHALELLETQTLHSFTNYMNSIKKQAEQGKSKAVKNLTSNPAFSAAYQKTQALNQENIEHPKLLELKDIIQNKINQNPSSKIIVFSQFRDSVTKICKELNSIKNTKAKVFVGQTKKADSGLSQKEQKQIINDFSNSKFNILCATSIGEEGLDIPEVNAVIFYEPVPSAIRKIQRAGRTARLMPGELIMLVTKNTRDEAYYWSAHHKEKRMHKAIDSIKQDFENKKYSNDKQKTLI